MIAIDLRKQQALDSDPKAIQQIKFAGNLSHNDNRLILFILEEAKEIILGLLQGTVKVLCMSAMVWCWRFIWLTNSSDHRRV